MNYFNGVTVSTFPSSRIPVVIQPKTAELRLAEWIKANKQFVDDQLIECGALLFRGFASSGETDFPEVIEQLCHEALSYVYRSTPRTQVGDKIYTATEYPAHKSIPFHNEEAYQRDWPMRLIFLCAQPAEEGGETPIADTVRITDKIAPEIQAKFREKRVMYVRNYGTGVDLDWQTVFQTQEKAGAERYCREHEIEFEWRPNGCLRTWQVCQAMAPHPETGKMIWFNQAHLFHVSSLDEKTRRSMLKIFKESELPRNTYYGDGTPIEEEALDQIRTAFDSEKTAFVWAMNDVMVLDNMLVSHSRNPYKGKRRVLVGMGDAYSAVSREANAMSANVTSR